MSGIKERTFVQGGKSRAEVKGCVDIEASAYVKQCAVMCYSAGDQFITS
jgi:hypothetical protein